jgi:hypothetical protein
MKRLFYVFNSTGKINNMAEKYEFTPEDDQWWLMAGKIARHYVGDMFPCQHCGYPVVEGYCCEHCGSAYPGNPDDNLIYEE